MKTIKRGMGLLVIVGVLSLLYGCPYKSEVPLGESCMAPIDQELLGEWCNTKEGEHGTMIIRQFNDHELLVLAKEHGTIQDDMIRAFITVVKEEKFLNVQEIGTSTEKAGWYLVNYTISGDTLTARTIDDKLFPKPVTSSRALLRFVKKNLQNKDLYGDDPPMVFKRAKNGR